MECKFLKVSRGNGKKYNNKSNHIVISIYMKIEKLLWLIIIINLTILECKYNGITLTATEDDHNKSNHIGM